MAEKLTLASMCAGGVQERIDRALAKISDNILDLNTDAKKKRTLDIKIVLTPSEDDREDVAVEVQTSVKLAPEMGLKTQLFINKDFRSGVTTLTEHAKGAIKGHLLLMSAVCAWIRKRIQHRQQRNLVAILRLERYWKKNQNLRKRERK